MTKNNVRYHHHYD